jgi:hypothetical protein
LIDGRYANASQHFPVRSTGKRGLKIEHHVMDRRLGMVSVTLFGLARLQSSDIFNRLQKCIKIDDILPNAADRIEKASILSTAIRGFTEVSQNCELSQKIDAVVIGSQLIAGADR